MRTFLAVWASQCLIVLGQKLTAFALGVWIFQRTSSVTLFALTVLASSLPDLLLSTPAGGLVDARGPTLLLLASAILGLAVTASLGCLVWARPDGSMAAVLALVALGAAASTPCFRRWASSSRCMCARKSAHVRAPSDHSESGS